MKTKGAQALYSYWQTLRAGRPAPERREIDPVAIKSQLADVFILEHRGDNDFRFRLAGSSLCLSYCRELKGRNLLDMWRHNQRDREAMETLLLAIREEAAAAVLGYEGINLRGQSTPFEMVLLPLSYRSADYPRILGFAAPLDAPYWIGTHPVSEHALTGLRLIWPDEEPNFLRAVANAKAFGGANLAATSAHQNAIQRWSGQFQVIDGGKS